MAMANTSDKIEPRDVVARIAEALDRNPRLLGDESEPRGQLFDLLLGGTHCPAR